MKRIDDIKEGLTQGKYDAVLKNIYVDEERVMENRLRYVEALERFAKLYPEYPEVEIYSAPGRSEVCGNHTDHQNGVVLATSINLDAIAVVSPTEDGVIRLVSGDFPPETVDLSQLEVVEEQMGTTTALIRGMAAGLQKKGYRLGGFVAYVTSDVLMGAGMSSSAAFESLIGAVISGLYNAYQVSGVEIAKIGQFAENVYFGKPCGLMDQMACSVGGMIFIDFADHQNVVVEKVETDFKKAGLGLCIVDTKGSHADLTPDYAAIPTEMNAIANILGKEHLREVDEKSFYANLPMLREMAGGRAILRAIHFYEEEKRVYEAVTALKNDDYQGFLEVIRRSGDSSAKYLQNIYSPKEINSQNVTVALAVTESVIGDRGVCRIHGGGFAGTIQVFIKDEAVVEYKKMIEAIYGADSCHILKVRNIGETCVIR